jgi:hypothetical protein
MREYFHGLAAENDCRNSTPPMRSHYDQVADVVRRRINDGTMRVFVLDAYGIAANPVCLCGIPPIPPDSLQLKIPFCAAWPMI